MRRMLHKQECFPDGTPIDDWFYDHTVPTLNELGLPYKLTDYGILGDGKIHTQEIQQLIDMVATQGGGVIVVPAGTFMTGSLHFKQGVNLYIDEGGVLKGSDDISDYDLAETRIEGESCTYFAALINADGIDGFTMCGPGIIDGNGLRAWKAFWLRRQWNRKCTNKDEQRPRLVYISNCSNVVIAGLQLQNSHFWTTHIYRCDHVKYLNCRILSPAFPVLAPSTDAIDIDVCSDVLIKNCYMEVNDDAVVLKGGKGPWAGTLPENGMNERVIVEDCRYGYCHSCLTCGSESIHNRNILMRRVHAEGTSNLLWLKMRIDTPQHYEYITVENATGRIGSFLYVMCWSQFADLKDCSEPLISYADHVVMQDCKCECDTYMNILPNREQFKLRDFTFARLDIQTKDTGAEYQVIEDVVVSDVTVKTIDA